jgi:sugar phosphate isomerase/epimerase
MVSKMKWAAPTTYEAINVLSENGYDGVEWMLGYHFKSPSELRELVKKTRSKDLQVSNIMCWQDLVTNDRKVRKLRVSTLCKYISEAAALNIPILNVFTGPIGWVPEHEKVGRDISEQKAWNSVIESFSEIVGTAEKNQVVMTVEAVFGMLVHDYYSMKEFLSHFDSDFLAVNLDPSHLALYGNDPAWALSRFGQKVKHIHVKDVFGKPGVLGEDFYFPFLGEGVVDWKSFFRELRQIDYSGFLSLEFENEHYLNNVCDGDWRIAAKRSLTHLEHLLNS